METSALPVIVLKDFSVTIDDNTYSGKKGETMELPFWIGKALEEIEFVGLKTSDLKKYLFGEGGQVLGKLPPNFYDALKVSHRDDRDTKKILSQLLDKRVEKIALQAAYSSPDRNICHEERVLFTRLASAIREWKAQILGESNEV
jgi:hypothetical protein